MQTILDLPEQKQNLARRISYTHNNSTSINFCLKNLNYADYLILSFILKSVFYYCCLGTANHYSIGLMCYHVMKITNLK